MVYNNSTQFFSKIAMLSRERAKQRTQPSLYKMVLVKNYQRYLLEHNQTNLIDAPPMTAHLFLHNKLSHTVEEQLISNNMKQKTTEEEKEEIRIEPEQTIYNSLAKACVFLDQNDNSNFSHYKRSFEFWQTSSQNISEKLKIIRMEFKTYYEYASEKNTSSCCFFSKKNKEPSLSNQFIKDFLTISDLACPEEAEAFQNRVEHFIKSLAQTQSIQVSAKELE